MNINTPTGVVVVGGSMAGLLAAHVLALHFDAVTIIERDRFLHGDAFRQGVPQARHVHVLQRRGQMILEHFFPDLGAEFGAAGVPCLDQGWDVLSRFQTDYAPRLRSDITVFSPSRTFLEAAIRRRVLANPRIHMMSGCAVTGLLLDSHRRRVTGVHFRRNETPDETDYLLADMVVTADGRASRLPDWLEDIGYDRPAVHVVNPRLGYASRWYSIPPECRHDDWQAVLLQPVPPHQPRGAMLMPVEGDRWIVTLIGANGDYPPTTETEFMDFARSLPDPVIADALSSAAPLSAVHGFRGTENRLVAYDRLSRWPENLVVLGDAVCALNPSYGQGMTAAAVSVSLLDDYLRGRCAVRAAAFNLEAHQFQKLLSGALAQSWQLAASQDVRWPAVEGGRRGIALRLMHILTDQVLRQVPSNPPLYQIFLEIMHGLQTPSALFQPHILGSLLRGALRKKPRRKTAREVVQRPV